LASSAEIPLVLKQCTLRRWRLEDAEALTEQANNRKVSMYLRDIFPFPYQLEDAHEFLERAAPIEPATNLCIEVQGRVAGGIGLMLGEDVHRRGAQFGYWLGEQYWGRGIMSEVVGAFVEYSFVVFDLHRMEAEVYSGNPASGRVLEKNGFVLEGRRKESVYKHGRFLDAVIYGKLQ